MNPAPPVTRTVVTRPTLGSDRRRCPATCVPREPVWPRRARDHRRVVRAELERREEHAEAGCARRRRSIRSRRRVFATTPPPSSTVPHAELLAPPRSSSRPARRRSPPGTTPRGPGRSIVAAGRAFGPHVAEHRGLQPAHREVEVARSLHRAREPDRRPGRRRAPSASSAGPPGNPSPSSRATLSNASPAASSSVWPSTS